MHLRKIGVVLLALLLAAMAIVPYVSAADDTSKINKQDIKVLFKPINDDIENQISTAMTRSGLDKSKYNTDIVTDQIVKKYRNIMNQIIDSLEKETGQNLNPDQQEDLKKIIVREHMARVSWAKYKEKLGVKDEDFQPLIKTNENTFSLPESTGQSRSQLSFTLVQVADDVNGGAGIDGGGRPYNVNGNNILSAFTINTNYQGKALYECHFTDEDVPYPAGDAAYDAFRMQYYGTLADIQGFYIYDPDPYGNRNIQFGNDYDNGCSFGTGVGQHGSITLPWSSNKKIYISNVWNHAMSLTDRNGNMAKWTHYY